MKNIIIKELKIQRKVLVIWSVILFLTAAFGGIEFKGLQGQMEMLEKTVVNFPKIVKIAFGIDAFSINTSLGGYASLFYWYQLIAFAFAIYLGVYIIGKDEHEKTVDFLYTKPYERKNIILAKSIVVLLCNAVLAITAAVGTIIFLVPFLNQDRSILTYIITSSIGMFLTQLIFSAIGILCGSVTKNYKRGLRYGFLVLIVAYIISYIIEYAGTLNHLNILSPVRYFNLPDVALEGLSVLYIALTVVLIVLFLAVSIKKFQQRDLIG
jgi:ABC-2 type transport system permease protein